MEKEFVCRDRETWLMILSRLNMNNHQYWYFRGMLDVIMPQEDDKLYSGSRFVNKLYEYLKGRENGFKSES